MLQNTIIALLIFLITALFTYVEGQTPVKPSVVSGDVTAISTKAIEVKAATGEVTIEVTEKTEFKRVAADKPSLATATASQLSDIAVGDKVLASGILSADGKNIPARTIYLMTKSDISQKHAKEAELWRTRGVSGQVTAVNQQTNQVTVKVSGLMSNTEMTLTPKADAAFLRYAPNSVRFDEAVASSLGEIKVGDMLRALGDKSSDGMSFSAEKIITGAFQTVAGTVISVDPEKNEVLVKNLQTNKENTISISKTSILKKYPAEMAERLAGLQMAGGGARPAGQGGRSSVEGRPEGGQGRPGMGGQRGGGNIDDMLERFPNITAADLKPGDMIAVSSTKNGATDHLTAIKLLAGVEPFIRMAQASGAKGRGRGVDGSFSIPGLDGGGLDF